MNTYSLGIVYREINEIFFCMGPFEGARYMLQLPVAILSSNIPYNIYIGLLVSNTLLLPLGLSIKVTLNMLSKIPQLCWSSWHFTSTCCQVAAYPFICPPKVSFIVENVNIKYFDLSNAYVIIIMNYIFRVTCISCIYPHQGQVWWQGGKGL